MGPNEEAKINFTPCFTVYVYVKGVFLFYLPILFPLYFFRSCVGACAFILSKVTIFLRNGITTRVARFFLLQLTKTGKIYHITFRYTNRT
jgi:hypothetical protein